MTLLLEDSGWYLANYNMDVNLGWGRNQGTDFVTSPCNQWKGAYHCNTTQLSGCTCNREAEGYCPIVNDSGNLPQWARYFSHANKVARSQVAFVLCGWDGNSFPLALWTVDSTWVVSIYTQVDSRIKVVVHPRFKNQHQERRSFFRDQY